jgi:hypothetical protein
MYRPGVPSSASYICIYHIGSGAFARFVSVVCTYSVLFYPLCGSRRRMHVFIQSRFPILLAMMYVSNIWDFSFSSPYKLHLLSSTPQVQKTRMHVSIWSFQFCQLPVLSQLAVYNVQTVYCIRSRGGFATSAPKP